jgi:hypothetical protein
MMARGGNCTQDAVALRHFCIAYVAPTSVSKYPSCVSLWTSNIQRSSQFQISVTIQQNLHPNVLAYGLKIYNAHNSKFQL